jgi:hypothetical protein
MTKPSTKTASAATGQIMAHLSTRERSDAIPEPGIGALARARAPGDARRARAPLALSLAPTASTMNCGPGIAGPGVAGRRLRAIPVCRQLVGCCESFPHCPGLRPRWSSSWRLAAGGTPESERRFSACSGRNTFAESGGAAPKGVTIVRPRASSPSRRSSTCRRLPAVGPSRSSDSAAPSPHGVARPER